MDREVQHWHVPPYPPSFLGFSIVYHYSTFFKKGRKHTDSRRAGFTGKLTLYYKVPWFLLCICPSLQYYTDYITVSLLTNPRHLFLTTFTYPTHEITSLPSCHDLSYSWIMQHLVFSDWLFSISNKCHFLYIFPWFCGHSLSLVKNIPLDDVTQFWGASWLFPSFSSYAANIWLQIFTWVLSIKVNLGNWKRLQMWDYMW